MTSVSLASAGAAATAGVGTYTIAPSDPLGSGLGNYVITLIDGTLTVSPAPLTLRPGLQSKVYGAADIALDASAFEVEGLRNADRVESAAAVSEGAAVTATPGTYGLVLSDPVGRGLENYDITFGEGTLTVTNAPLTILAGDQSKIYGDPGFALDPGAFTVVGLVNDDSVTGVGLASEGEAATATVGAYEIVTGEISGSGLEFYDIVTETGTLTVDPQPLTVTALDQTKREGTTFTFAGTEFSVEGLRNSDTVDAALIESAGAAAEATVDAGPFPIYISGATGSGLVTDGVDNYVITYRDGIFTVEQRPTNIGPSDPNVGVIIPPRLPGLFNPSDTVTTQDGTIFTVINDPLLLAAFGGGASSAAGQPISATPAAAQADGGTAVAASGVQSIEVAESALVAIDRASRSLSDAASACRESEGQVTDFLGCISEALESYSAALDPANLDLPQELASVSATINVARQNIDAAVARANGRLAGVTDPAQRRRIEQDAIAEARAALDTASEEVSKALTLIRADDPALANTYLAQVETVVAAINTVDLELQTVAGL